MNQSKIKKLDLILISIIGLLIVVILTGTLVSVYRKSPKVTENLLQLGKARNLSEPVNSDIVAYYQLGTIRIVTAPESSDGAGTAMVVSPWLAYPEGDTVFYEELARKRGVMKGIFSSYFANHSKTGLLTETEVKTVENLIAQINEQLSLGKISDIYFTDYLFLE